MSAQVGWMLALRVCGVQLGLTVAVAVACWFVAGSPLAALAGGGAATFMTLYFAARVFSVDAAADPRAFMRRFYRAEAMKLVMTVLFFALAAKYGSEVMAEIVIGFIVALLAFWVALWPMALSSQQSGQ